MNKKVLGLIPARGGSKGVPHKNKRLVAGRPLIDFAFSAATGAASLTHVAVTTDDADILQLARNANVLTIDRPTDIAQDASPVIDAIRHAVQLLESKDGLKFDAVVLLQPTTPLRSSADIDRAVALYFEHGGSPVCSVYRCEDNHPARMYTIGDGHLRALMPEWSTNRRQDLPPVYHRNGALYVFGQAEIDSGDIITASMVPYIMRQEDSINIDSEIDLVLLEAVLSRR